MAKGSHYERRLRSSVATVPYKQYDIKNIAKHRTGERFIDAARLVHVYTSPPVTSYVRSPVPMAIYQVRCLEFFGCCVCIFIKLHITALALSS